MNDDWAALCAIYGEEGDEDVVSEIHHDDSNISASMKNRNPDEQDDERHVRLMTTNFPKGSGFCGTVYMTLSTSKVVFARRVNDAGNYRYFTLQRSPCLKLDFLYRRESRTDNINNNDVDNNNNKDVDDEYYSEGPSSLRLVWDYYPTEWPQVDQDSYRSCLAKKCNTILQEEGISFAVCEFLEHHALSYYKRQSSAFEDGWKNYVDVNHPDFQLIILPPELDRMYQPTIGTLIHPQQEAAITERRELRRTTRRTTGKKNRKSCSQNVSTSDDVATTATTVHFVDAMTFGRYALIQFWKELYTTKCPICLDDSGLFSEGVVLPYCQHYACRDCFQSYLQYKVQDLKQFRTNPFVCPVETCQRELPIVGYCKQYLSDHDMDAVRNWYRDLKNPPCWSLDRCLYTKTCGAVGSMRRRKSGIATNTTNNKNKNKNNDNTKEREPSMGPSYEAHLVYCEACNCTWCELCLKRVYYDYDNTGGNGSGGGGSSSSSSNNKKQTREENEESSKRSTPYNHRWHCQPQGVMKFCRRYMAASKEIQGKCQERYPWIVSYSLFCQHDGEALQYVLENGQRCPTCQTGVERIEGCFHMKCPTCATHFCYECGTELFPPYYGTHHCWEEEEVRDNHDNDNYNNNHFYHDRATNNLQDRLVTDTDEQFALALYLEQAM
jgi:hypothetical protein